MVSVQSPQGLTQDAVTADRTGIPPESRRFASAWTLFWAVTFVLFIAVTVRMADGHLVYTLDDPYIHLSLASHILHGGFGINEHEYSSPSSSILYPLILVPTLAVGLGTLGPILINTVATGLSVWLAIEFLWRRTAPTDKAERWLIHLLCPFVILSINAYGLPMTGMEHSLHVLTVIVVMREMAAVADRRAPSPWLYAALLCMPFLRFEGLALAGAALVILFSLGQRRVAATVGLAIVVGLLIDAAVMRRLGLPFLPSSVLLKSRSAADVAGGLGLVGVLKGLATNLALALRTRWGLIFSLVLCLVIRALWSVRTRRDAVDPRAIGLVLLLAGLGAHLLAGQYGWFHRYEVYAVAILVMGALTVLGPHLLRWRVMTTWAGKLALLAALALLVQPYADATVTTPFASQNIYHQQFQMHRFATEFFPHNVAVNDLGWVSFQNRSFVLDLWGLGSEPVRKARAARKVGKSDIRGWTQAADVDYAMIYEAWFVDAIPDEWCLMAVLETEQVTAAGPNVLFLATKRSVQDQMRDALQHFAQTLPAPVTLKTAAPCP